MEQYRCLKAPNRLVQEIAPSGDGGRKRARSLCAASGQGGGRYGDPMVMADRLWSNLVGHHLASIQRDARLPRSNPKRLK